MDVRCNFFYFRGFVLIFACKFQIGANAIVGSLYLSSLIFLYTLKSSILDPNNYFQLFLHNMVIPR